MKINEIINEGKTGPGLWANIHAKRKRGGKMRKPGSKGAPTDQDFKDAASEGVAEGSTGNDDITRLKSGEKTSDGIGMQDIRLMAGEGKLTKKTVLQALAVIRKQRSERSVAEGSLNEQLEETYHDDDEFFEAYGVMEYNDEMINESEYQGRKVTLNKPMQGDVKKFKVYVKNPKGNVVKVNFGDPNSTIKKNNPARRKSFRARHNCDNPGPKTGARFWSCRKW